MADADVASDPALSVAVMERIDAALQRISSEMPADRVADLRRVPIAVHRLNHYKDAVALYAAYPYAAGDPADRGDVEILDARRWIASMDQVPSRLLHELAHAYQFRRLGEQPPSLLAAYRHAKESGKYAQVKDAAGNVGPSYAMTSAAEYFALLTQAYFERSGYYPFDRDELSAVDPEGFALVVSAWYDQPPQFHGDVRLGTAGRSCDPVPTNDASTAIADDGLRALVNVTNDVQEVVQLSWYENGMKVASEAMMPRSFSTFAVRPSAIVEISGPGPKGRCLTRWTVTPGGADFIVQAN